MNHYSDNLIACFTNPSNQFFGSNQQFYPLIVPNQSNTEYRQNFGNFNGPFYDQPTKSDAEIVNNIFLSQNSQKPVTRSFIPSAAFDPQNSLSDPSTTTHDQSNLQQPSSTAQNPTMDPQQFQNLSAQLSAFQQQQLQQQTQNLPPNQNPQIQMNNAAALSSTQQNQQLSEAHAIPQQMNQFLAAQSNQQQPSMPSHAQVPQSHQPNNQFQPNAALNQTQQLQHLMQMMSQQQQNQPLNPSYGLNNESQRVGVPSNDQSLHHFQLLQQLNKQKSQNQVENQQTPSQTHHKNQQLFANFAHQSDQLQSQQAAPQQPFRQMGVVPSQDPISMQQSQQAVQQQLQQQNQQTHAFQSLKQQMFGLQKQNLDGSAHLAAAQTQQEKELANLQKYLGQQSQNHAQQQQQPQQASSSHQTKPDLQHHHLLNQNTFSGQLASLQKNNSSNLQQVQAQQNPNATNNNNTPDTIYNATWQQYLQQQQQSQQEQTGNTWQQKQQNPLQQMQQPKIIENTLQSLHDGTQGQNQQSLQQQLLASNANQAAQAQQPQQQPTLSQNQENLRKLLQHQLSKQNEEIPSQQQSKIQGLLGQQQHQQMLMPQTQSSATPSNILSQLHQFKQPQVQNKQQYKQQPSLIVNHQHQQSMFEMQSQRQGEQQNRQLNQQLGNEQSNQEQSVALVQQLLFKQQGINDANNLAAQNNTNPLTNQTTLLQTIEKQMQMANQNQQQSSSNPQSQPQHAPPQFLQQQSQQQLQAQFSSAQPNLQFQQQQTKAQQQVSGIDQQSAMAAKQPQTGLQAQFAQQQTLGQPQNGQFMPNNEQNSMLLGGIPATNQQTGRFTGLTPPKTSQDFGNQQPQNVQQMSQILDNLNHQNSNQIQQNNQNNQNQQSTQQFQPQEDFQQLLQQTGGDQQSAITALMNGVNNPGLLPQVNNQQLVAQQSGQISQQFDNISQQVQVQQQQLPQPGNQKQIMITNLSNMAEFYATRGDYLKAIDYYRQLIQIEPNNGESWTAIGHCYLLTKDIHKAYSAYQRALYAIEEIHDPQLWYGIGILYERFEEYQQAISALIGVLKMSPNFYQRSEVLYKLGSIYAKTNQIDQAIRFFQNSIMTSQFSAKKKIDILIKIGLLNEEKKDFQQAKRSYEAALSLNEKNVMVYQHLAWCSFRHGNINNAMKYIGKADKIDKDNVYSLYIKGRCLNCLDNQTDAFDNLSQAVQKQPNEAVFWTSLAVLLFNSKKIMESFDNLYRASTLKPSQWEVWYNLGILYETCNQPEEAIIVYDQVHSIDAKNQDATKRISAILSSDYQEEIQNQQQWGQLQMKHPTTCIPNTLIINRNEKKVREGGAKPEGVETIPESNQPDLFNPQSLMDARDKTAQNMAPIRQPLVMNSIPNGDPQNEPKTPLESQNQQLGDIQNPNMSGANDIFKQVQLQQSNDQLNSTNNQQQQLVQEDKAQQLLNQMHQDSQQPSSLNNQNQVNGQQMQMNLNQNQQEEVAEQKKSQDQINKDFYQQMMKDNQASNIQNPENQMPQNFNPTNMEGQQMNLEQKQSQQLTQPQNTQFLANSAILGQQEIQNVMPVPFQSNADENPKTSSILPPPSISDEQKNLGLPSIQSQIPQNNQQQVLMQQFQQNLDSQKPATEQIQKDSEQQKQNLGPNLTVDRQPQELQDFVNPGLPMPTPIQADSNNLLEGLAAPFSRNAGQVSSQPAPSSSTTPKPIEVQQQVTTLQAPPPTQAAFNQVSNSQASQSQQPDQQQLLPAPIQSNPIFHFQNQSTNQQPQPQMNQLVQQGNDKNNQQLSQTQIAQAMLQQAQQMANNQDSKIKAGDQGTESE